MQSEVSMLAVNSLIEALCKAQSISNEQLQENMPAKCRSLFAPNECVDCQIFLEFMDWADGFYQTDWKKVGAEFSDSVYTPRTKKLLQQCTTIKFAYWLVANYLEKSSFHILKQLKFETGSDSMLQYSIELKQGFSPNKPFFLFIAGVLESVPQKLFSVAPAAVHVSYSKNGVDYVIAIPENITVWKWINLRFRALFSFQSLLQELVSRQEEINEKNQLLISKNSEFQSMIENSPDGVLVVQYDIIRYVNPRMLQYLKYESSAELIGKSIFDKIIPPETLDYAKRRIAELNQEQKTISPLMDFETQTKIPGERFLAETNAVPVTFNGVRCLAVTFRDLSDRKKLQAHLMTTDRMVALGQLAAGVGHEINNPLCYVMRRWLKLKQ